MTAEELNEIQEFEDEKAEDIEEAIRIGLKLIPRLAIFAGMINLINLYSCELALFTVMAAFAISIYRIGYFCCTGR